MRRGTLAALALFLATLFSETGCGSKNTAPQFEHTVPVKGTVTYRGKPLPLGQVTFEPDSGRQARGHIQLDGTYVLSSFQDDDGAVPGTYRVFVSRTGKVNVPVKYQSASSSKIVVEVKEGKTDYPIDLK